VNKYRVLIAEDNEKIIGFFKEYAKWNEFDMEITKIVSNGFDALSHLKKNDTDIAIIDLNLAGLNGNQIIEEIGLNKVKVYPMVMGGYKSKRFIEKAISCGARDVIYKNIDEKSLNNSLSKCYYYLKENALSHEENAAFILLKSIEKSTENPEKHIRNFLKIFLVPDHAFHVNERARFNKNWTEFVFEIKKKYSWLNNLIDFSLYSNLVWEKEMTLNEIEEKATHLFSMLQEVVHKFDIGKNDGRIRGICELAVKEIENNINLDILSEKLDYSKNHVCTLFKQKTGMGFIEYVNRVKIQRAKLHLLSSSMKNAEVALTLGFKNTDYFMKMFKNETGMTPGEYRIFARKNRIK